jgi:hypothetical protein
VVSHQEILLLVCQNVRFVQHHFRRLLAVEEEVRIESQAQSHYSHRSHNPQLVLFGQSVLTGKSIIVDKSLHLRHSIYPDEIPEAAFAPGAKAADYSQIGNTGALHA